jgi:S1-C subfamily serine protease
MQPLSLTTAKLDLLREKTSGGSATGFFYALGDLFYLITNWHVVTGVNPVTQRALDLD